MASQKPRVLFLTISDYGESTVMLATLHELLVRNEIEVHIGSNYPLFSRLNNMIKTQNEVGAYPNHVEVRTTKQENVESGTQSILFHTIEGPSPTEIIEGKGMYTEVPHKPGFGGFIDGAYKRMAWLGNPWSPEEYISRYDDCMEVIKLVQPDYIVVNSLLSYGVDAAASSGRKYAILAPIGYSIFVQGIQPRGGMFWKFPAPLCGIQYPLPFWMIPYNIFVFIYIIIVTVASSQVRNINAARKKHGIDRLYPLFNPYVKGRLHICPAIREIDLDYEIPDDVVGCGPIVLPVPAGGIARLDPELNSWLNQAPTILINLGNHVRYNSKDLQAFALGISKFLSKAPKYQVIWKAMPPDDGTQVLDNLQSLDKQLKSGQVRTVEWFEVDPEVILAHENVICSVHHGGANSHFQACMAGVSQVVLPLWYDCYDCAARVEYLGIGAYGNKKSAPGIHTEELFLALDKAMKPETMAKARFLAEKCVKAGGRIKSAEVIAREAIKEQAKSIQA